MFEFLNDLDAYQRILWYIALPVSLIFVIQVVLTFIGMDAHDGADVDFHGDFNGGEMPFQLFSLRNLINFLLGFSWGGIALYEYFTNKFLLTIVALLIGTSLLLLFFWIMKQVIKLSQDNTLDMNNAIGQVGSVYLTIPGNNEGKGKIQITIQQTLRDIDAVTDGDTLKTGAIIKVVAVINNAVLKVEKI